MAVDDEPTVRVFNAGQKFFKRFTLQKILGRGGMGVVWLAFDEELERKVALKFLPDIVVHDHSLLGDLKRETRRSLELTHPNIVRIHDFLQDSSSACISMEYVDGENLSALRQRKNNRVFECPDLEPVIKQWADAMEYAHNHARIVHCDLKPANLLLTSRGVLKIADFGIARSISESVTRVTQGPRHSGTLVYMSPQQLDGERPSASDDIYAIGATLYELLTSKPPFYRGQIDAQIREKEPPALAFRRVELDVDSSFVVPISWEETIAACLAKDPKLRPESAREVARRLLNGQSANLEKPSSTSAPFAQSRATGKSKTFKLRHTVLTRKRSSAPVSLAETESTKLSSRRKVLVALVTLVVASSAILTAYVFWPSEELTTAKGTAARPSPTSVPSEPVSKPVAPSSVAILGENHVSPPATSPSPSWTPTAFLNQNNSSSKPAQGIPDGSTLGIVEIGTTGNPNPGAETDITLRVAVEKRVNATVDHTRVKIQVYFYDILDTNKIALTDAEVNYEWLTPNHDWKATNPEVLLINYIRLKNDALSPSDLLPEGAAVTPGKKGSAAARKTSGPVRKYAGYQVRVYYNDELQDVRAEPTKLLNLFPPPLTLSPH